MSKQSNGTLPDREILVSVIIPTYRRRERLQHLVSQLLAQDVDCSSYEIIVVDDGSPEPVRADVQMQSRGSIVSVRCLRKENGGPASARNFGAREARGKFLLFVDDDMLVRPDFIRGHVETQLEFGPALVYADFQWQVGAEPEPFHRWYERTVNEWDQGRLLDLRPIADDVFELASGMVTTANLSVGRADFEAAGGFDEGYQFGCEDQDFAGRLRRAGIRALATRKTIATHVETHNTLRRVCKRQRLGAIDAVRFIRRFAVEYHCGEQAIATMNGPLRVNEDSWPLIAKKLLRQVIASDSLSPLIFGSVFLLERAAPNSDLVQHVYDLVVSAYVQKGWREGLRRYNDELPMKEWAPAGLK